MRNLFRFGECCLCVLIASVTLSFHSVTAAPTREATFSAWDYRFDGPETIPAGQTPDDLAVALKSGAQSIPSWAKQMGGPNGVAAGHAAQATLYLEPGSYVIVCGIPGKNHQTHAVLGMQKALRVTGTKPPPPE